MHDQSRRALVASGLTLAGLALARHFLPTGGKTVTAQQGHWPIPAPTAALTPVPSIQPTPRPRPAQPARTSPRVIRPELLTAALAALDHHGRRIAHRDRIAIADFAAPSSERRFHFLDLASGHSTSVLVAHGSGSDPEHSGWLKRFSNQFGSNASSEGAFLTSDYYIGKHGRSQRLQGLDPTNDNALDRALVIHGAWYADADMLKTHGQIGRSQGCFAVGEQDLDLAFRHLGTGRLLFAAKV